MKTVKNNKKSTAQIRKERLRKLINACLDRYTESEMMQVFREITSTDYVNIEDIEEPEEMSEYEMSEKLASKGYCIFKPDNFFQAEQLKEYAATNIFPYYNEQQTAILF